MSTNEKSYDELNEQEKQTVRAYLDGMRAMQNYVIRRLKDKICFDHIETGNCKHQLCFGVESFIDELEGRNP